jgi:hypothetical protein
MHGWIEGGNGLRTLCKPSLVGFPLHIRNLALRPNVLFRIAVALQAPLHRDRLDHANDLHLIDAAVARCAPDPRTEMRAVIEKGMIR